MPLADVVDKIAVHRYHVRAHCGPEAPGVREVTADVVIVERIEMLD